MSHLNVDFNLGFNLASQAWLLPENFNLAINGQIRQIAKLKLSPNFPVIRLHINFHQGHRNGTLQHSVIDPPWHCVDTL